MTEEKKNDKVNKPQKSKRRNTNDKEKRVRFNILDALVLICVLAVAILLIFVYSPLNMINTGDRETAVIYSVRIYGVPAEYAGYVDIGDAVNDRNGYDLGKVASAVEVEQHVMFRFDPNSGGVRAVVHPDLVDLIITISANAEVYDDGYLVDGRRIAVEGEYELLFPSLEAHGICVSLSEENANDEGGPR